MRPIVFEDEMKRLIFLSCGIFLVLILSGFEAMAHNWVEIPDEARIKPPWITDDNKMRGGEEITIKVIFVRFPGTAENQKYINQNQNDTFTSLETLFHYQSNTPTGYHNIQYEIVYCPGCSV